LAFLLVIGSAYQSLWEVRAACPRRVLLGRTASVWPPRSIWVMSWISPLDQLSIIDVEVVGVCWSKVNLTHLINV